MGYNGVWRRSVAALLFLCVSIGWSVHALAACPQPATTVFFEASASLNALAQRLGGQLQGVRNAEIQQGLDITILDALVTTLPPDFPEGDSLLFAGITVAGTQNLIAPLATAEFTFEP